MSGTGFPAIEIEMVCLFGVFLIAATWVGGMWTGVVVLAKMGRTLPWWVMLIGLVLSTLGAVFYVVLMRAGMSSLSSTASSGGAIVVTPSTNLAGVAEALLSMIVALLGVLMIGAGFAMHAFRMVRLARRAAELETLCSSMVAHGGAGQ